MQFIFQACSFQDCHLIEALRLLTF